MSKLNPISEERKKEIKNNIIKELKAMIFPLVVCAVIALAIVFVLNYQKMAAEEHRATQYAYEGDGEPIVLENDYLKLTMDATTTNFDIEVKSSGKVWHSYAEGGLEDTIAATTEAKNKLMSSFLLTYAIDNGLTTTYGSYEFSAINGIYNITSDDDHIRVDYSIGKVAKKFTIPPVMLEARFDELTGMMPVNDKENVKQFYKKWELGKIKKEDEKKEMLEKYPDLETNTLYILRSGLKDTAKKSIESCFANVGYTEDEYYEDLAMDKSVTVDDNPVFDASVIYRLDGDDLVVEVPFSSFDGPNDKPIYAVNILPYFGAANKEQDGFMVVPEGGGSIINFNNGKISQNLYASNLYGWDMGIERSDNVHTTMSNMNVYGISNDNDSFICILEDGSSYATVQADVSGKTSGFNYVTAEYLIKPREKYDLGQQANTDMFVYLENLPDESIVKRYSFVDSGSYVDMAKDYRNYLFNKYPDSFKLKGDTSVPVAVEVVGAVDKVKQICGIPVSRPLALTTYDECNDLIMDLNSAGINNLYVKYTGWCNGGVTQQFLDDVHLIHALGNKKQMNNLSDTCATLGVKLYLDGITQYAYDSNIFDGFFSFRDAAKFLSKKRAELYQYSSVTYAQRDGTDSYYLLHSDLMKDTSNALSKYASKFDVGVSFQDIGYEVSSDFYKKNYTSREEAKNIQIEALKACKDKGQSVMINAGNDYALPYVDFITDMDLRGSEYTILDGCIPFYQIALHGYLDYTGYPINVSGNDWENVLYAAEYGAGLSFTLMKESSFTLQKTLYTQYYASDYDAYGERLKEIYTRFNNELGHTYKLTIEDHKNITEDVSMTKYSDGTTVYVNYGFSEYEFNDITIPARDYLVIK